MLRVPFGLDPDGAFVMPEVASKGVEYRCPGCRDLLTFRQPANVRPHFAHRTSNCTAESILHAGAKAKVLRVVSEWIAGHGPAPVIRSVCSGGTLFYEDARSAWWDGWACGRETVWPLAEGRVDHVEREHRLASGLRPDVVLFRGGRPTLAIEFRHTHSVSEQKAARLEVPWIELVAGEVFENPLVWSPSQHGIAKLSGCAFCASIDVEGLASALAEDVVRFESEHRRRYRYLPSPGERITFRRDQFRARMCKLMEAWCERNPLQKDVGIALSDGTRVGPSA